MGSLTGPLIVFVLGVVAGFICQSFSRRFWIAVVEASIVASLLWITACYALFVVTAPSELGPPAIVPVVYTIGTALAGALVAGGAMRIMDRVGA